jgi:hypothetical protein
MPNNFQGRRSNSICNRAIDALEKDMGRVQGAIINASAKVPLEDDQKLLMAIDYKIRKFYEEIEKLRDLRTAGRISEAIWED